MRRFPAPSFVEALEGGFKIVDANGQTLETAKGLTLDEARRIAANIAKLPNLHSKED